jgi:hypothetical protein
MLAEEEKEDVASSSFAVPRKSRRTSSCSSPIRHWRKLQHAILPPPPLVVPTRTTTRHPSFGG